ncbi:DUF2628 domain-containing protein [Xanthobacter sp. DSM 24535]|uniref:DUF2628 domain-containing protein n=1 Tax=Roseixanthobacter psychrophilus TaxID=3119917 RepID=UPI00372A9A6B
MAIWTVLTKEKAGDTVLAAADRVVFVREKFSWTALLFAPFVLLGHRLWLGFGAYVAASVLIALAETLLHLPNNVGVVLGLGLNLLVALQLADMRIWKLRRTGYLEAGSVVARDIDEAERRFFKYWTPPRPPVLQGPLIRTQPATAAPGYGAPIIGSFPEPRAS